jgi:hypothetical protein
MAECGSLFRRRAFPVIHSDRSAIGAISWFGMQSIQFPLDWVVMDVFAKTIEFRFVSDNVFPVVALPQ